MATSGRMPVDKRPANSFSIETAIQMSGSRELFLRKEAQLAEALQVIDNLEFLLSQERSAQTRTHTSEDRLTATQKRHLAESEGRSNELASAVIRAEAEIAAQIRARLELEQSNRVCTTDLRNALKAVSARDSKIKELESAEKQASQHATTLSQRLSALRVRNEQLERQREYEGEVGDVGLMGSSPGTRGSRRGTSPSASGRRSSPSGRTRTAGGQLEDDARFRALRAEFVGLQASFKQAQRQILSARGINERCRLLEGERVGMHAQLMDLHGRAQSYESRLSSMMSTLSDARDECNDTRQALGMLRTEHEACVRQLVGARKDADAAHQAAEHAAVELTHLRAEAPASAAPSIGDKDSECGRLSIALERERSRTKDTEAIVEQLTASLRAAKAGQVVAEESNARTQAASTRSTSQLDELRDEVVRMTGLLSTERRRANEATDEKSVLELRLAELRGAAVATADAGSLSTSAIAKLRSQLVECESFLHERTERLAVEQARTTGAQDEVSRLHALLSSERARVASSAEEALTTNAQLSSAIAKCTALTNELESERNAADGARKRVMALAAEVEEHKAVAAAAREALSRVAAAAESDVMQALERTQAALDTEKQRAENGALLADRLKMAVEAATMRADDLQSELTRTKAALATSRAQILDSQAELDRTRESLNLLITTQASAEGASHCTSAQVGTRGSAESGGDRDEMDRLRVALAGARQAQVSLQAEAASFHEALARARAREAELLHDLEHINDALLTERRKHESTLLEWEANVSSLVAEQRLVEATLKGLAADKAALRNQVEALRARLTGSRENGSGADTPFRGSHRGDRGAE